MQEKEKNEKNENLTNEEIQAEFNNLDELNRLKNELEELKNKTIELEDQSLRAKAEVENMRRRSIEEVVKARKFGIEMFAESLLPVCDSLEAALIQTQGVDSQKLLEGTKATLQQLQQVFERNKVIVVDPKVGDKFDPSVHQAISTIESEQEKDTIVNLLQKGYLIAERVLRPALVVVAN